MSTSDEKDTIKDYNFTQLNPEKSQEEADEITLSHDNESALLQESQDIKAEATALFTSSEFSKALSRYEDALLPLPRKAHFARAVLHSNIAACNIKLEEWQKAVKAATAALDELAKLEGDPTVKDDVEEEEVEEEIISSGVGESAPFVQEGLKADIARIRIKSLLRRARAHANTGGWASLSAAESDYKELLKHQLGPADARTVKVMLCDLPPKVKAAQEAEVGEMWGKLKELGNGLLKPFGLSTDNFQMTKDENSGGYSMNFNQGSESQ